MRTKKQVGLNIALAATIVAAMTLAGCTNEGSEASTELPSAAPTSAAPATLPTATKEATPEYSPEEQAAIEEAKAAVLRFYEVSDAAFAAPMKFGADAFDDVAIDPVRTERLGALGYFTNEGQHMVGRNSVEIARTKSVETTSEPEKFIYPEIYFAICVDSSNVDFIDSSGKAVPSDAPDRASAVIGAYKEPGEGWFVDHLDYQGGGDACK